MSAPGSNVVHGRRFEAASIATTGVDSRTPHRHGGVQGITRGFTLIELMVVMALIAVASAVVSLSIRDPGQTRIEREATRLAALLESARAESRASGLEVSWEPVVTESSLGGPQISGFRFRGLPNQSPQPTNWLTPGTMAQVVGGRFLYLGPEPLIGAQRLVLREGDRSLLLATDGLTPFTVIDAAVTQ